MRCTMTVRSIKEIQLGENAAGRDPNAFLSHVDAFYSRRHLDPAIAIGIWFVTNGLDIEVLKSRYFLPRG